MKYSNPRTYFRIIYSVYCILCTYSVSFAQDFNIGFGTNVYTQDYYKNSLPVDLYMPMDFYNKWRIEPKIRFNVFKIFHHETYPRHESYTHYIEARPTIECGLFRTWENDNKFTMYTGFRIGYSQYYFKYIGHLGFDGGTYGKQTYSIAPAFGMEYHLMKHFSLGCEADVYYNYTFNWYINFEDKYAETYYGVHTISTKLLIHLRWYWK